MSNKHLKESSLRSSIRKILEEESKKDLIDNFINESNIVKKIILEISNGNIPDSDLVALDTPTGGKSTAKLNSKAAKDFNQMVKAAKADKIDILVSQGYRPLGSKEKGCSEGFTQWCAWIKYKSGTGNLAAKPGTSNHGKGSAIDVKNCKTGSPVHSWLVKNASKFNFRPLPSESWHWDHSSSGDISSSPVSDTSTNTKKDETTTTKISNITKGNFKTSDFLGMKFADILKKIGETEPNEEPNILKSKISKTKPTTTKDSENSSTGGDVILLGGLDYRSGDLNITQQADKVKSKLSGKNVLGFRYKDLNGALNAIKENPNSYVILFSAGCNYSSQIANAMEDKTKLFIVEPYAPSSGVVKTVNSAVSSGVPSSNVITGPNKPRGAGIVSGATKTPSNFDHWGALEFVTKFIK
jgi:hypothetical protein